MKYLVKILIYNILFIFFITFTFLSQAQNVAQWRGINRDGIYQGEHLLKSWPEAGPQLLWSCEDIGFGYGSPVVAKNKVYLNGECDSICQLFAFDLKGKLLWKSAFGKERTADFPGSRSAPTVVDGLVYVSSAMGKVACFDSETGVEKWTVDLLGELHGRLSDFGYCESLLVDGDNVYCSPGAENSNIVSLNRFTGKPLWVSKATGDTVSCCSPIIIKLPSRSILVTFSYHDIIGIDTKTGELLWTQKQNHINPAHCNTPIFDQGSLYYVAAGGNGAVKLELSTDGSSIKEVWRNESFNNFLGGFVKINNHLFTTGHRGKMKSLDVNTGQIVDSLQMNSGATIYADEMLYCFTDKGEIDLIKLTGTAMEIVGKLKCVKGTKEYLSHPVINKGVLYIRHGNALMAYDIKEKG
jgi:outer membrane protein assembly factor BamB